jgi:hypothetical protein
MKYFRAFPLAVFALYCGEALAAGWDGKSI